MNIVAKKSRSEDGYHVESVADYDKKKRSFRFFQRLIRTFKGGALKFGAWYKISKDSYDLEDREITYNNHPKNRL